MFSSKLTVSWGPRRTDGSATGDVYEVERESELENSP